MTLILSMPPASNEAIVSEAEFDSPVAEIRYRRLASRIRHALGSGRGLVFVVSDPPAEGHLLRAAFAAAPGAFRVIGVPCGLALTRAKMIEKLARFMPGPSLSASGAPIDFSGIAPSATIWHPTSLFVFDEADRLDDDQIKAVHRFIFRGNSAAAGAVLLGSSALPARLRRPQLRQVEEQAIACYRFQEFGPEDARENEPEGEVVAPNGARPKALRRASLARSAGRRWAIRIAAACAIYALLGLALGFYPNGALRMTSDQKAAMPAVPPAPPHLAQGAPPTASPSAAPAARRAPAVLPASRSADASRAPSPGAAPPVKAFPAVTAGDQASADRKASTAPRETRSPSEPSPAGSNKAASNGSEAAMAASPAARPPPREKADAAAAQPAAPATRRLSPAEIGALIARGDAFVVADDIASARLFYERAADAGDAGAAQRMAETFDPAYLDQVGPRGGLADADQLAFWNKRARALAAADRIHASDAASAMEHRAAHD